MIYLIILSVVAIIILAALLAKKKREVSNLKLKVEKLERENQSAAETSGVLREIIFFSQLGYNPEKDDMNKLNNELLETMWYISKMRSKNLYFNTDNALREANKVQREGLKLSNTIEYLQKPLLNSIVTSSSPYSQIRVFLDYCGFKFCGKELSPTSKIQEFGRWVHFGHVEE